MPSKKNLGVIRTHGEKVSHLSSSQIPICLIMRVDADKLDRAVIVDYEC